MKHLCGNVKVNCLDVEHKMLHNNPFVATAKDLVGGAKEKVLHNERLA
jgi:hypothetical protein